MLEFSGFKVDEMKLLEAVEQSSFENMKKIEFKDTKLNYGLKTGKILNSCGKDQLN